MTLKSLFAALSVLARDFAGVAGAAAIAYGAGLIYRPAGFIVGGLLLVAASVLLARAE
jgi:hypothetical protein